MSSQNPVYITAAGVYLPGSPILVQKKLEAEREVR